MQGRSIERHTELPKKWRPRYIEPLRVLEKLELVTYRLEMPPDNQRGHNVFNVDIFKRFVQDKSEKHMDIMVNGEGTVEQEVLRILKHQGPKRRKQFLVQCVGEKPNKALWHTLRDLVHCKDLIKEYKATIVQTPRRTASRRK